jgi:hypothetical protein
VGRRHRLGVVTSALCCLTLIEVRCASPSLRDESVATVVQRDVARFQFQYLHPGPALVCVGFAPRGQVGRSGENEESVRWRDPPREVLRDLTLAPVQVRALSQCTTTQSLPVMHLYIYWPEAVPDGAEVEVSRVGGWGSTGGFRAHVKRDEHGRWRTVSQRTKWISSIEGAAQQRDAADEVRDG